MRPQAPCAGLAEIPTRHYSTDAKPASHGTILRIPSRCRDLRHAVFLDAGVSWKPANARKIRGVMRITNSSESSVSLRLGRPTIEVAKSPRCRSAPLTPPMRTYILTTSRQTVVASHPIIREAGFQHRRPTPSVKSHTRLRDCQRLLIASPAWKLRPSVSHNAPCCVAYPNGWSMWATENTGHKITCVPPAVL